VAEGEIKDKNGVLYAKATGKFFLMNERDAKQINEYLTYQADDVNVLADN
jgi:hypothetical protein